MHMPQVLLALNCRSLMATVFWLPCVQVRLRLLAPLLPYEQAPWAFWPTPIGRQAPQMLVWQHDKGVRAMIGMQGCNRSRLRAITGLTDLILACPHHNMCPASQRADHQ